MISNYPVYLFDVDGTLMDSAPDIIGAQRQVLIANGYAQPLEDAFFRRYIGRHLIDLFCDLGFGTPPAPDAPRIGNAILTEGSVDQVAQMIEQYRQCYTDRRHAATRVFPGVAEMLATLGGRKSTATTKGSKSTRAVLEQFGLIRHFDHIQGTDGFPAKPAPDVLLESLRVLGARPEECLFIGDSPADMEAGRRAGVRICAVRWGYGDRDAMARWQPDYWADSPSDLLAA